MVLILITIIIAIVLCGINTFLLVREKEKTV